MFILMDKKATSSSPIRGKNVIPRKIFEITN